MPLPARVYREYTTTMKYRTTNAPKMSEPPASSMYFTIRLDAAERCEVQHRMRTGDRRSRSGSRRRGSRSRSRRERRYRRAPMDPRVALQELFGFKDFRPGQEAGVTAALADRDALVVMPTGSGKSLCYQLPALIRDDVTIVVSPLVSLMQDQVA